MPFPIFPLLNAVTARHRLNPILTLISLLVLLGAARPISAQQTFTYRETTPAIHISGAADSQQRSTITVTNPGGATLQTVSVTIRGLTVPGATRVRGGVPSQIEYESLLGAAIWLQGPNGRKIVLLGATGDGIDGNDQEGSTSGLKNATITISDSAPGYAPGGGCSTSPHCSRWTPQNGTFTVKPSSYLINRAFSPSTVNVTSPGELPHNDANATLTSIFGSGSSAAAGNWQLVAATIDPNLPTPITIDSWSITFIYAQSASVATTTSISSSPNPAAAGNNITFTATVTASGTTVSSGTVTFTSTPEVSGGSPTVLCSAVAVSGGVARCTVSADTLGQGISTIEAGYSPGSGFLASSASMDELVEGATTHPSGDTWCNTGSVLIPNANPPQAYPSIIKVSGYPSGSTVSTVSVQLNNLSGSDGIGGQYLLVAPGGQNLDFMDGAFNAVSASGINLTVEDDAGQTPAGIDPAGGNYEPYDGQTVSAADAFPSSSAASIDSAIPQLPGSINYPAPHGSVSHTLASSFDNAPANGDWVLYTVGGNAQTLGGGWCVDLTINTGVSTATAVTSSRNPATSVQSVTYTASVTSSGNPVTSGGTVTFLDNNLTPGGTTSGNNVVNLNTTTGTATFTSSSLFDAIDLKTSTADVYEGDHTISGAFSGTDEDNPSQGSIVERFDNPTTFSAGSGGSINACNSGPVYSGQGSSGPFTPNPSNIFAANIPGTINAVTLTLNNFYTSTGDVIENVESMVAGPNHAGLDFFSGTGGSVPAALSQGNYVFSDSASSNVPSSTFGPGTYKPTSYLSNDVFKSSLSGLYNLPGSFAYSQPQGSATFASTFGNINPNGAWSLFFDMNAAQNAAGAVNGWCLNFKENPVSISINESHNGTGVNNDFAQGENGAQITTTITNNGTGSTGDPLGTNPLTLTDTLNNALTYAGFSGTGWSCSATAANTPPQAVTCTNDNAIAQGSEYPVLTLDVNVSLGETGTFSNSVNVSGAGITSNLASDTITVDSAPVLGMTKSHTGNFTQGSTGEWTLNVYNEAANGVTSGVVTVQDTLPAGYTLNSYTSTSNLWTCSGANAVTCTASPGLTAGNYSYIYLTVNVPSTSPTSVSNIALVWGGGDLHHTSVASGSESNTDTVTVVQAPDSVSVVSGNNQAAAINTAFGSALVALVKDAGGNAISGQSVTFTANAGANGQSGTFSNIFSNNLTTITTTTNNAGQASESITANSKVGAYTVTATAGSASAAFALANLTGAPEKIVVTSGSGQSATIHTAFANPLIATVTDAGGNPVTGAIVTFNAPSAGIIPALTFSNAASSISVMTNASGQASSGAMTANGIPGGPYNVSAVVQSFIVDFQFTNLHQTLTTFASLTANSATIDVFGYGFAPPSGTLAFADVTTGNPVTAPATLNAVPASTTLLPQVTTSTGTDTLPCWTTLGDVNGDGIPDLVTSLYQTDSVSVQLGNGDGTFKPATIINIADGFGPAESHLFSLRGNGTLDLIVGSFNLNQIAVLLGNGDGTFQNPVFYTVGSPANWPSSLTAGDFDFDGHLDVAVANTGDNTVSILFGNGSGALTVSGSPIAVGRNPEAIRAGDFNGDGFSDLAVANYDDGTVTILVSNLFGSFTRNTLSTGSGAQSGPQALAITGSGSSLQLAVANYSDNTVSVMNSNGNGTFSAQTIVAVDKGPDDVNFTDFNGDGIPDLVVTDYTDGTVDLLLGKSGGGYSLVGPFTVGKNPYSAAVGDLNLDGTPDLVTSNCFSNSTGTLLSGTQIATPYTGLSLAAGNLVKAVYTPGGGSQYGTSASTNATVP